VTLPVLEKSLDEVSSVLSSENFHWKTAGDPLKKKIKRKKCITFILSDLKRYGSSNLSSSIRFSTAKAKE
jgi:hypothetical protein